MLSFRAIFEESFDAGARQGGAACFARVEDDVGDEVGVRIGSVGIEAVEVERGCESVVFL